MRYSVQNEKIQYLHGNEVDGIVALLQRLDKLQVLLFDLRVQLQVERPANIIVGSSRSSVSLLNVSALQ